MPVFPDLEYAYWAMFTGHAAAIEWTCPYSLHILSLPQHSLPRNVQQKLLGNTFPLKRLRNITYTHILKMGLRQIIIQRN